MPAWPVSCSDCGTGLDGEDSNTSPVERVPCPTCGSLARTAQVTNNDSAAAYDGFRLKARHGQPGEVKAHLESFDEVRWNADRQRLERRVMRVDRENDYYKQEWFDLQTGRCTFSKEGKLSDPDVHGESARRTKRPPG
jgi:hypothetical protein